MKRPGLIVLLAAVVGLSGWAVAQTPSPDTPDQPVRLKKKKRSGQEQPPPPPKVEEQPDPPDDPKKPDDPPRPKLDEEERLDDKDDLKMNQPERDEREVLERIARNARASEGRLGERQLGEGTRQIQGEVLKDIDSLLEQDKNQDNQDQQNQNQNQDKQSGQSGSQGNSGGSRGASGGQQQQTTPKQRREARRKASRGSGSQQGSMARNQKPGNGTNPGGGGPPEGPPAGAEKPPDRAFDLWGSLPEKERALMNKEMEQKFMDKYDDLTKQYYRALAEKSRLKK